MCVAPSRRQRSSASVTLGCATPANAGSTMPEPAAVGSSRATL